MAPVITQGRKVQNTVPSLIDFRKSNSKNDICCQATKYGVCSGSSTDSTSDPCSLQDLGAQYDSSSTAKGQGILAASRGLTVPATAAYSVTLYASAEGTSAFDNISNTAM